VKAENSRNLTSDRRCSVTVLARRPNGSGMQNLRLQKPNPRTDIRLHRHGSRPSSRHIVRGRRSHLHIVPTNLDGDLNELSATRRSTVQGEIPIRRQDILHFTVPDQGRS